MEQSSHLYQSTQPLHYYKFERYILIAKQVYICIHKLDPSKDHGKNIFQWRNPGQPNP
jgi:hypothetical protein